MPGAGIPASNTGRTADGRPAARIAGRRGAGVPSAGGATGFLLRAWSEARSRLHQLARPTPARALCASERRTRPQTCSPARASSTGHRPRSSRRCSMKASICAPMRTMYRILAANHAGARAAQSAQSSLLHQGSPSWWPRGPTRPRSSHGLSPGHRGPQTLDVLLPLGLARHLQPLRRANWMVADRENAALAATLPSRKPVSSKASSPRCSPCIR